MSESSNSREGSELHAEPFLTKQQVAQRLQKKPRTVDNYMKHGILPYFKIGRSVLFRWSDVQRHLESHYRIGGGIGSRVRR